MKMLAYVRVPEPGLKYKLMPSVKLTAQEWVIEVVSKTC